LLNLTEPNLAQKILSVANFSGFDDVAYFSIFGWRLIFHDLAANFFDFHC
jgi:hypothetical protein